MRILFVIRTLDPAWGGPVQGFTNLSKQAQKRGLHVEVACVDDPSSPWLDNWHLPVHGLGPGHLGMFGYTSQLDAWLDANIAHFDAVIVHGIWMYFSFAVWKAAGKRNIPYYLFIHGALDPWFQQKYPHKHLKKKMYWRIIEGKVLRDAAAVLFTTEEEKHLAHNAFYPYECNPVVVGYGITAPKAAGIPPDRQALMREMTAAHPALSHRPFILYLGRIHEKKGIDLLLRGFAELNRQLEDKVLVLAGPGDPASVRRFKALGDELHLRDRLLWAGPLYDGAKWLAMRSAEVYVLPSHQENFGISVVEALACGTPVLISNKVNIWREVHQEGAGLVAPNDLEGVKTLLNNWSALSNNAKQQMRSHARSCFNKHFDIEANSQLFLGLLQSAAPNLNRLTAAAST